METLRIKDNTGYEISELMTKVPTITSKLANKTFKKLTSDGIVVFPPTSSQPEDIDNDQMVLQSVNGQYRAGNILGFVGCGNERLVISSRFGGENNDFFMFYMLGKALNLPNISSLQTAFGLEEKLLQLFALVFPSYLKSATRKGLFKTYIWTYHNDTNVKGSIDVARHIRQNTPFLGRIAYNQRVYSFDNDVTELVRHTIEFIKGKPYGSVLLSQVKDEIRQVIDATPSYKRTDRQNVISKNKRKPITHAYYYEYRELQKLCILILQQQKHELDSGKNKISGILFDGAWLWEEYINTLVSKHFHHPRNKSNEWAQHLFTKANGQQKGKIYPDFIGKKEPKIVADAKYKPIDNIRRDDYFQLLAYMFRFNAKTGFYFYPSNKDDEKEELFLNEGSTFDNVKVREDNHRVKLVKLGLRIPKENEAENFERFETLMKEREDKFKEDLSF